MMTVTGQLRLIGVVLAAFAAGNFWYLNSQITDMTYDGRVVNFAGVVRGGTQRLIKIELSGKKSDELIAKLDAIMRGLLDGSEELDLPRAKDPKFIQKMNGVISIWSELKARIQVYRGNYLEAKSLIELSEKFFEITNAAVSEAEQSSKDKVVSFKRTQMVLFCVNLLVLGAFFFMIAGIARRVKSAIGTLKSSSQELSVATKNVSDVSQAISDNSTRNAAVFEEITSSVEELTSVAQTNMERTQEASQLAKDSSTSAAATEGEIKRLMSAVEEIAEDSKKIQEIISVMDEIAFQTNLLSLNASVEAARAGQHGRGFAVVAEAVRDLAQKSAGAAKNVSELISSSVVKSENGAKIAQSSRTVLESAVSSIRKVHETISEIASASTQQSQALSQISRAMVDADVGNQNNSAQAEEAAASSEELTKQVAGLQIMTDDLSKLVGDTGIHQSRMTSVPKNVIQLKKPKRNEGNVSFEKMSA